MSSTESGARPEAHPPVAAARPRPQAPYGRAPGAGGGGRGRRRSGRSWRRWGAAGIAVGVLGSAVAVSGLASTFRSSAASAAATSGYTWKNVQIAGGGFIPGIEYSRAEKGLAYLRTDIGGIYRRDPGATTWTPLTDWVGPDDWGYNGPVSLAPDPVDANKVYAAVGMYTNDWDPNNGAVIRSADRGKTWQVAKLPFKQGGNMPGRGTGERLAVDPHKNSVLYLGAANGNGLWRSTDSGATWAKVAGLTNPGSYADKPGDSYQGVPNGILWVTFDPRSGSGTGATATATKTIYVGVADKENPVYRSTDAGTTWAPVKGTPTGFLAHHGVLDEKTGMFFIATSDTVGPYDGSHGDVWRLDTASDTWKQVSPIPSSNTADNHFGYSGLTVDRQKPGTLMVSAYSSWWPDTAFWRSTDSGATWTRIWDWTSYPNRSFRYTLDASGSSWLDFNNAKPSPPDVSPKLGWMTEAMEIDPFNSDNLLYGTGATLYGTNNLTDWDTSKVKISVMAKGVEETAVLDLISPPSGAPLLSGLGDIGGFRHDDLDTVPAHMFAQPTVSTTTSLDFVEQEPKVMVRAGNVNRDTDKNVKALGFSSDGGKTWFQANAEPPGTTNGGTVAAAAQGQRFVWAPMGGPVSYAEGFGNSWTPVKGLDNESIVKSDRVNAKKFYAYKGGRFFVSADGGATFTQTVGSGLTGDVSTSGFRVAPGKEGDIWLAGGSGLYRSTDSGTSFKPLPGIEKAWAVGFGKAAPGKDFPAVYVSAKLNGKGGIYRSDDAGASWVRINDDQHQWGMVQVVQGDPRTYGRVYLGTNGRGVLYGDGSGGTPATPAPGGTTAAPGGTTAAPAPSGSTSASAPAPTGGASDAPGASCTAQVDLRSWRGGYLGTVTVVNNGAAVQPWNIGFTVPAGLRLFAGWNANLKLSGTTVTATAPAWHPSMAAGSEVSIGFVAAGPSSPPPGAVTLNGKACAATGSGGNGGTPSGAPVTSTTPAPPAPSTSTTPPRPVPSTSTTPAQPAPSTTTAAPAPSTSAPTGNPGGGTGTASFADGFESQTGSTPAGKWTVTAKDCSGTGKASIDSTVAHSGSRSLRIDGGAGYCNHVFVAASQNLSTLGKTVFARMYVRHTTAQPPSHTTFIAMKDSADNGKDLRIGGQNSALQWNRESDDATLPAQSPAGVAQSKALPTGTWQCLEIEVNGGNGTAHTWLNGTEVKGLTADGVPTTDVDNQWYGKTWRPALTDFRLGWESYGEGSDTLWYDDVAIGTSRIGC